MRGHLTQGALPQSGRCALSALVSPPARFSDKCCPGIVITQINTGLAGEGRGGLLLTPVRDNYNITTLYSQGEKYE